MHPSDKPARYCTIFDVAAVFKTVCPANRRYRFILSQKALKHNVLNAFCKASKAVAALRKAFMPAVPSPLAETSHIISVLYNFGNY